MQSLRVVHRQICPFDKLLDMTLCFDRLLLPCRLIAGFCLVCVFRSRVLKRSTDSWSWNDMTIQHMIRGQSIIHLNINLTHCILSHPYCSQCLTHEASTCRLIYEFLSKLKHIRFATIKMRAAGNTLQTAICVQGLHHFGVCESDRLNMPLDVLIKCAHKSGNGACISFLQYIPSAFDENSSDYTLYPPRVQAYTTLVVGSSFTAVKEVYHVDDVLRQGHMLHCMCYSTDLSGAHIC